MRYKSLTVQSTEKAREIVDKLNERCPMASKNAIAHGAVMWAKRRLDSNHKIAWARVALHDEGKRNTMYRVPPETLEVFFEIQKMFPNRAVAWESIISAYANHHRAGWLPI